MNSYLFKNIRRGILCASIIGFLLIFFTPVRAVAPGAVANPTFGPADDDVGSFDIPCDWIGTYGYGGQGGTVGYRYIGIGQYGHHSKFSVGGRCENGLLKEVNWMHTYYGS